MRRRFFVPQFSGDSAVLEGHAAHHLGQVLRAQPGQLYELSDGAAVWLARVESSGHQRIEFALLEKLPAIAPVAETTLLLAIIKFDAFEWALEKATELGVARIIPLAAARSEKNLIYAATKRSERWRKILFESSQQSRRLRLPELAESATPARAFAQRDEKLRLMLSERPEAPPLKRIFRAAAQPEDHPVAMAIGPEGGWTEEELAAADAAGFREASLGPLILRTETAVISTLSMLNFWRAPH